MAELLILIWKRQPISYLFLLTINSESYVFVLLKLNVRVAPTEKWDHLKKWNFKQMMTFFASEVINVVSLTKHKNKTMEIEVKFLKRNYFVCKRSHWLGFRTQKTNKTMEISVSCRDMEISTKTDFTIHEFCNKMFFFFMVFLFWKILAISFRS